ncbi:MAG: lipopolysaccharide biosynthesis protein [Flavobacteriaceae bacterium]|nr:lipopolysaccharide biosynthesis protein [Flavobacteriaceae bacterium]
MNYFSSQNPLKSTLLFSVFSLLQFGVSIVLVPIFLNYLTPEDYGVISLVLIYATIVATLSSFGLKSALYTFYFDFDTKVKRHNYLKNIFSAHVLSFIVLGIIHLFLGNQIFNLVFISNEISFFYYGCIALLSNFFALLNSLYFIYLKNEINLKSYFKYTFSTTILTAFLQLFFIVICKLEIYSILLGTLIPHIIIFVFITFHNPFLLSFRLEKELIYPSLKYGIKLLPFLLFFALENQIDRYLIEINFGLKQVGLYAVIIKLFSLVTITLNALDDGIRPFMFNDLKHTKTTANHYFNLYLGFGIFAVVVVTSMGYNLQYIIVNTAYLELKSYLFYGAIVFLLLIPIRFYALLLVFYKDSSKLSYLTCLKVLFMIVLMTVLIPEYQLYGVFYALVLSNLINIIVFALILRKKLLLHLRLLTIIYGSLFIIGSYILHQQLNTTNELISSIIYLIVFTSLFLLIYFKSSYDLLKTGFQNKLE